MICPRCGSALTSELPDWARATRPTEEPLEYEEFVPVLQLDPAMIPLAKSLLMAAGIRHFVRNERTHALVAVDMFLLGRRHDPLVPLPWMMVERERAHEAGELLAGLDR